MPRLSRTSSASSHSYTAMPPALDAPAHAGMPYYHQGRVPSLTGNGFYDQIPEGVPSTPVTLSANVAAAQAVAYQDTFAVGPPLTMGGPGGGPSAVMMAPNSSNGGRNMRPSHSTAVNYPVQHPRAASTAWRPQDDDALVRARARGENWAQIQTQFPGKTPNACRKRHERLMERRNADDFDTRKMEHIAREYMNMRREIWQPLAQRTGEKWTFVEQKCMASGLKNLQGVSRAAARRERLESGYAVVPGFDDDLGGPGGHGHGGDLIDEGPGSSPAPSTIDGHGGSGGAGHRSASSGASNSSTVSLQTHHSMILGGGGGHGNGQQAPMPATAGRRHQHSHSHSHSYSPYAHHPQQHPQHLQMASAGSPVPRPGDMGSPTGNTAVAAGAYPDYYATTTGFSQTLRAIDVANAGQHNGGGAPAMSSPYMSQHPHPQQHQRLSAADMGIDSLLHRR